MPPLSPHVHWNILERRLLLLLLARVELDRAEHAAALGHAERAFAEAQELGSPGVLAACAIITYSMYTVDEETAAKFGEDNHLVWTVPFVVFGLFRYLLMVTRKEAGGSPTKVLLGGDLIFAVNGVLWMAVVASCLFAIG